MILKKHEQKMWSIHINLHRNSVTNIGEMLDIPDDKWEDIFL